MTNKHLTQWLLHPETVINHPLEQDSSKVEVIEDFTHLETTFLSNTDHTNDLRVGSLFIRELRTEIGDL